MKPNIIIILADDLGYGDIGVMNHRARTPNMDQFAAESLLLRQHYSASPVCAPARAALLTGRYPHRTGVVDTLSTQGLNQLASSERTLADDMKSAGYRTGLIGKWHLGTTSQTHPRERGFDEFAGFLGGWVDYWTYSLEVDGRHEPSDGTYLTDRLSELASEFVQRNHSEPFFLYLAFNAPHYPLQAPDEVLRSYDDMTDLTTAVRTIHAMIEVMDTGIGRVLQLLEELGIADDTLVLIASDNGPDFGGEGDACAERYNAFLSGSKGNVFEGGIRVPAILRWPNGIPSLTGVYDGLVHLTDWAPTLRHAAGLPAYVGSRQIDGVDLLPSFQQASRGLDQPVRYWQFNRYGPRIRGNAAIRDGRWKLIRPPVPNDMLVYRRDLDPSDVYCPDYMLFPPHVEDRDQLPEPPRNAPLLFDIEADPHESSDVAAQNPDVVARMDAALERWFEDVCRERFPGAELRDGFT